MMQCTWGGKDGYMWIIKYRSIIEKLKSTGILRCLGYAILLLILLWGIVINTGPEVSFVYNNF